MNIGAPSRLSAKLLCGLFVLLPAAVATAGSVGPPAAATLTKVEAKLVAVSTPYTPAVLAPYKSGLIVDEWELVKLVSGPAPSAKRFRVHHWAYLDLAPQAALNWKPGLTATLTIRPLDEVPVVNIVYPGDSLPDNVDAPAYYDTAQAVGLPAALAKAQTAGKISEAVRKQLGSDLNKVLCVNGADCHGLNDMGLLYGGTGRGKAVSVGGPGTGFGQHELGYRMAAAECPNLEWGIQSGGADRPCGGFGGAGYIDSLILLPGPAWPPLPGRGPAPVIPGANDVTVLPGVGRGDVESLGVLQNCIREYGRRGKGFVLDLEFRLDGQYLRSGNNQAVHERFLSWGKVYPNFLYFHIYDPSAVRATVKNGLTVSCATIEKARVAADAKGLRAKLMPWTADPPDAKPDAAALAKAVQAGGSGGNILVGGAWIAKAMAGAPGLAAFADAGMTEAELVLRSAVAANKKPKCVAWGIEPLMLTAPQQEKPIGALPGSNWPTVGKPVNPAPSSGGATVIRLGNGTTVARGKGTWEFGLEYSLILEAALRELKRHQIGVVLVLGPNAAGIPDLAYQGLADRLRAYTVMYDGVRFVEPAEIVGKPDAQVRSAIEAHLADPKRGVLKSNVLVREEPGLKRLTGTE